MNRHELRLNDDCEEADFRDSQESFGESAAVAEATSARPSSLNVTMSEDIAQSENQSFTQRDELRSAFSSVRSDDAATENEKERQAAAASMPQPDDDETDSVRRPYRSYYQAQHYQRQLADADADAQYQEYQYQRQAYTQQYPSQNQYNYPGYYSYPTSADPENHSAAMISHTAPGSGGQYHPSYPAYPQYYPQEYEYHEQDYTRYAYFPSSVSSGQYYDPGAATTPHSSQPNTSREAKSAVTECTTGTPSQHTVLKSPSTLEEDDRKPPASEQQQLTRRSRVTANTEEEGAADFEPIPLHQISDIPTLSLSQSVARGSSSSQSNFSQAYAPTPAVKVASSSFHVAPPIPNVASTPRVQPRILVPSSGGSNASSTGGEGGSWEKRYNELCEFNRTHGHCEVPQNYANNSSLGTWVNKQRMEHKNRIEGRNSSLNDSRLDRLQMIGFRWAKRKGQVSWNEKFNDLVQYKARHGNCHVPTKYKANTALGRWVSTQRAEYKKYSEGNTKTTMNAEKVQLLEGIGFAWFMSL